VVGCEEGQPSLLPLPKSRASVAITTQHTYERTHTLLHFRSPARPEVVRSRRGATICSALVIDYTPAIVTFLSVILQTIGGFDRVDTEPILVCGAPSVSPGGAAHWSVLPAGDAARARTIIVRRRDGTIRPMEVTSTAGSSNF
jgi:hypothetical protein